MESRRQRGSFFGVRPCEEDGGALTCRRRLQQRFVEAVSPAGVCGVEADGGCGFQFSIAGRVVVLVAFATIAVSAAAGLSSKASAKQIAVVGGTGAYKGARGTMTSSAQPNGPDKDVIHLLP